MHRLLTFILLSFCVLGLSAQKVKKSTGEYQLMLTRDMSEAQACETCQQLAMIEAIEKAFGKVLIQGNTMVIENTTTGESVETSQTFNMIAETYVNGDWLETLDESCERFEENDQLWVRCRVKGRVQELVQPEYDIQVAALDCETVACSTDRFVDGEPFYLYVKSPVDGYITVYMGDPTVTQRLLPYRNMPSEMINAVPVKADEEYVLFSSAKDAFGLMGQVDEYSMYAAKPVDQNRVYVIFSQEPLVKPALYAGDDPAGEQVEMPMEMETESFQKWVAKQRRYNSDMQVKRLDVMITKN